MRLQEFINGSLQEIIAGVKDAQKFAKENGARINPTIYGDTKGRIVDGSNRTIEEVTFDVAVTATEGVEGKGGIGVFFGPVGIGGQAKKEQSNEYVSRLRFSVNVALPHE